MALNHYRGSLAEVELQRARWDRFLASMRMDTVDDPEFATGGLAGNVKDLSARFLIVPSDPLANAIIFRLHFIGGDFESAVTAGRAAIDKGPNVALAHFYFGHALAAADIVAEGLEEIEAAIRLSPKDPYLWVFENIMAMLLCWSERYDEAHEFARRAVSHPTAQGWAFATHASVLGHLGRIEEGRRVVTELKALQPDFSPEFARRAYPGWGGAEFDRFFAGLRKAGLDIPDEAQAGD